MDFQDSACVPKDSPDARGSLASDDALVRDLLTRSRAEHLQKKHCAGKADKKGIVTTRPNYPQAEDHIRKALRYREEAEALDPQHLSSAWIEDQAANKGRTSAELLDWFRHYLTLA